MSKQLAISAALSVFAMAAFVLFGTQGAALPEPGMLAGAEATASAPALGRLLPTGSIIAN